MNIHVHARVSVNPLAPRDGGRIITLHVSKDGKNHLSDAAAINARDLIKSDRIRNSM